MRPEYHVENLAIHISVVCASHVNIVAFAWMVEWLPSRAKRRAREAAAAADKDKWRGKSAP